MKMPLLFEWTQSRDQSAGGGKSFETVVAEVGCCHTACKLALYKLLSIYLWVHISRVLVVGSWHNKSK